MKKDDWVAVAYFDMQPHILVDFTQDKRAVYGALNHKKCRDFPKRICLTPSTTRSTAWRAWRGRNTSSWSPRESTHSASSLLTEKIIKKIRDTKDVTIFPVSVDPIVREYCETHQCGYTHGVGIPVGHMDYLQGDDEM